MKEVLANLGPETAPWQVYLYLGILAVAIACRYGMKKSDRAHFYRLGMAYLGTYGQKRGACPEVLYNRGRAAQLFGETSEAARFYEDCLNLSDRTTMTGDMGDGAALMDFRLRAALNLRELHCFKGKSSAATALMTAGGPLSWQTIKGRL